MSEYNFVVLITLS